MAWQFWGTLSFLTRDQARVPAPRVLATAPPGKFPQCFISEKEDDCLPMMTDLEVGDNDARGPSAAPGVCLPHLGAAGVC